MVPHGRQRRQHSGKVWSNHKEVRHGKILKEVTRESLLTEEPRQAVRERRTA